MTEPGRIYPEAPIPTACGFVRRGDRVLLIKRNKEPSLGRWSLPGGKVELGETVAHAVEREVAEETGVEVRYCRVLDAVDNIIRDHEDRTCFHYVVIYCEADFVTGDPMPSSDAAAATWVSLDDVEGLDMNPVVKAVIRQVTRPTGSNRHNSIA